MYRTDLVGISRSMVTIRTEGFNIKKKVYSDKVLLKCCIGSNNMIHRSDWSF